MHHTLPHIRFYFCLVSFVLATLVSEATIGKYPIKNFSPADYKAGIQNIDFAQNRDMNLFIANNLGVLSFNGNTWDVHAYSTGKKQRSLAFDNITNRLYVGSQGDLGYFTQNWEYVSLIDMIPQDSHDFDEVWDVFIYDSKVYFCTFRAIYVYNGSSISVIQHNDRFNRSFFNGNRIYTQTTYGKILEIDGTKMSSTLKQGQENKIVAGLVQKDEGYVVFYNSGQIEFSTQ